MIDTAAYTSRLREELEKVTGELGELGIHNPHVTQDWIATEDASEEEADPNLVADRTEDWIEKTGEVEALEARFNDLKRALQKIDAGTFGICEIGGEEIEDDRLDANPAARTCKAHMNDEQDLPA